MRNVRFNHESAALRDMLEDNAASDRVVRIEGNAIVGGPITIVPAELVPDVETARLLDAFGLVPLDITDTTKRADIMVWADEWMEKAHDAQQRIAELEEVKRRRMDMIAHTFDQQMVPHRKLVAYIETVLQRVAEAYPYPPNSKTVKLAYGKMGRKWHNAKLEVTDEAAALAFAKATVPDAVKEAVRLGELKAWYESTGIVPDGCKEIQGEDKAYVTLEKP